MEERREKKETKKWDEKKCVHCECKTICTLSSY